MNLQHNWVLYEKLDSARGLGQCLGGALPTIFEKKHVFLVCHTEDRYFCTKTVNKIIIFVFFVWHLGEYEIPNAVCWQCGAPNTHYLHQKCKQICSSIISMGVVEIRKKCVAMLWRAERAYLCTKNTDTSFFGHLGMGVCKMHNTIKKCVCSAPDVHTSAPRKVSAFSTFLWSGDSP